MVVSDVRGRSGLLLVDTSKAQLDMWLRECRRDRATAFSTTTAAEAVVIARREKPAVAIVDPFLPDAPVPRIVEQLKLSSYMTVMHAVECVKAGADDCFLKPFSCSGLLRRAETGIRPEGEATRVPTLDEVEREHLMRVLKDAGGNVTRAAQWLSLRRHSLQRKLNKHSPGTQQLGPVQRRQRARHFGRERLRALSTAQQFVLDAFATTSAEMRLELGQQALDVSDDCVDAYVLVAAAERDHGLATEPLTKAVALGRPQLGARAPPPQ